MSQIKVSTALVSVSDKTGLDGLGHTLKQHSVSVLSTGGTARALSDLGVEVTEVASYTEFPEMMDGRVKTLHPRVHGGLLGRRGQDDEVMAESGIRAIDLLVVNLYPFEETVAKPDVTLADAIENIDIGGPAMLRSAAKNMARVAVVVDPADYSLLADELGANEGMLSQETRYRLARKAFSHVADYDVAIRDYLNRALPS